MNIETMVLCVNRLYNNYHPETTQRIRDDKIKFLMSELEKYQHYQFEKAVDCIIDDENIKKFPTIAQIKNYMPAGIEEKIEYCGKCEHTGYFNVWQLRGNKYYSFAYKCGCNTSNQCMPAIDERAIPVRAHNPFPPIDKRHNEFNLRKGEFEK